VIAPRRVLETVAMDAPLPIFDRREIGRLVGAAPGPTLVAVAGVHGNEPAGIEAARRVFARLERGGVAVRGELVVFAGNAAAMRLGMSALMRSMTACASVTSVLISPLAA